MIKYQKLPGYIFKLLPDSRDYLELHPKVLFAYLFGGLEKGKIQPLNFEEQPAQPVQLNVYPVKSLLHLFHRGLRKY